MNNKIFATLLTLIVVTVFLWSGDRDRKLRKLIKKKVPLITVQQLKDQLNDHLSGSSVEKPLLLDAREREEYDVSRLEQARFVGYKDFTGERIAGVAKDRPIVVYCSLGVRSEIIGEKLKKAGYTNVRNLLGGLFEWVNMGFPVYDSEGKVTKKVHAYSKKWGKWLQKGTKVYKVKGEE